ncbi:FtsX-like permease family protein [Microvirga puerhi]|uniref:ABC transporter permease n=1 Tax=Microvirga puerhi TaxID=2876078 RepID=A0ABS7VV88_9HYPH|nr:FtsX-like permease family protein [Microvirga puerhi]MBZ6078877.1 ABC transporter permease [Microvirga puerhi]
MIRLWLKQILAERYGRALGTAIGLALTVALFCTLGAFVTSASGAMTAHAVASVPVDWQVLVAPGADPMAIAQAIGSAAPPKELQAIGYAESAGFSAVTGETSQKTGPGKVLGIASDYYDRFPGQIQLLLGSLDGVLIAQQTAANLHVGPGDLVTIERIGASATQVTVAGVVALPNADAMFQAVGAPKGTAPQAPPDNVLIVPMPQWRTLFAPQAARSDTVRTEFHVRLDHTSLPPDPSAAFVQVQQMANNLEARVAGSAAVGNNLAAALDTARQDALYAQVLFLFLGTPGLVLAILFTLAVAAAGADRRRREQALLRLRGASLLQLIRLAGAEAMLVGLVGIMLGLALTQLTTLAWLPAGGAGYSLVWLPLVALTGLTVATAAFVLPAWREASQSTVSAARAQVAKKTCPLWQRLYLDLVCLTAAALAFWYTANSGYNIILATEGVTQVSVHYEAFIAPALLWLGSSLLWMRLTRLALGPGRAAVRIAIAPLAAGLTRIISASLARQHPRMAHGVALVALAFAFATSTAVFNTTYNAQSRVDAALTNGADVTVTGTATHQIGQLLADLRRISGVADAEPMMHRFAYVGSDLQDIFGIDPTQIGKATSLVDAYFDNHDVGRTLELLRQTRDGILVSEETVSDFQLQLGDTINLRLQDARDHQYHVVPFRFIGIVREFPTAPKDSFLVANASYLAEVTGGSAADIVLMRTVADPSAVAAAARTIVTAVPGAKVTTLGETQALISSNLTAVSLYGLTNIELAFAILMIGGTAGLVLALGLSERRQSFAVLTALGAKRRHRRAFLWSEGLLIVAGGTILGLVAGLGLTKVLVSILAGVFDPPPETLSIPWMYLGATVAGALVCSAAAIMIVEAHLEEPDLEMLRSG